jgi:putative ABC transport system ATP-binding protein
VTAPGRRPSAPSDPRVAAARAAVAAASQPVVEAFDLGRDFASGAGVVHALAGVSVRVVAGELVVVRGRSGAGKTTLLTLLGGLDRPTAGRVEVEGRDLSTLPSAELTDLRRHLVGYVFQGFGLLPILTAAENVELPLRLVGADPAERDERVRELLEGVGMASRANHRPAELSGGEQQRVAIARALANRPRILLADEPTGQLDSETGHLIMTLLRRIVRDAGVTAIVATHDPAMLDVADRVVHLHDGRIVEEG